MQKLGYISEITFNDSLSLSINENDIVVFVGPNNAGKSQALKDLYSLSKQQMPTIVIREIKVVKPIKDDLISTLDKSSVITDHGSYKQYKGNGYDFLNHDIEGLTHNYSFGKVRDFLVSYLTTETRLSICNPPSIINRDTPKTHPVHHVAFNSKYRKLLSKNFKKAFGFDVTPNIQFGQSIPLSIGEVKEPEGNFDDVMEKFEAIGKEMGNFKQVHQQGDGIRSFTGILLNLMIDTYSSFLIDEPESFLHPPQANIMGRMIGELLSDNQQAFISTHSQDIVKGLLDVCPQRVKVVRITRTDDTNHFSVLENTKFDEIWKDPILKHSGIMDSLFSTSTVLCEADTDCKMYSIILSHLKNQEGKYSETHFIHCGGKHRMPKVIPALKSLNVNFRVIPDIDVLNDKNLIKAVVESCGGVWDEVERDYNVINAALSGGSHNIHRAETKRVINELLDKYDSVNISEAELKEIRAQLKTTNKWTVVKEIGTRAIPPGNATRAFAAINGKLNEIGIFVVPCGELEYFIKEVGGHGPAWANDVLEQFPNLEAAQYKQIKDFVSSWNL